MKKIQQREITSPYDFIHRDEQNVIDVQYWNSRITEVLQNSKREIFKGLYLTEDNHEGFNGSHCFYLGGVVNNIVEITRYLEQDLPGCKVQHQKVDCKEPDRITMVSRFKTWIDINANMQKGIKKRKMRKEFIKGICKTHEFCMLIILICVMVLLFSLLNRHWDGYKEPWNNIIAFAKC